MDASLWVAKTGLNAQQTRMSVISNNLANVNTNGFKILFFGSKEFVPHEQTISSIH